MTTREAEYTKLTSKKDPYDTVTATITEVQLRKHRHRCFWRDLISQRRFSD